jgi:hypothetical protein
LNVFFLFFFVDFLILNIFRVAILILVDRHIIPALRLVRRRRLLHGDV